MCALALAGAVRVRGASVSLKGAAPLPSPATVASSAGVESLGAVTRSVALRTGPVRVSVVIPTLNEEASLPWVLERLPAWVAEVVLVDGLSIDGTLSLARRLRPDAVFVHQLRRGKGAALRAGFAAASGEIVVMLDADGSNDPGEMDRFVDALRAGADFVKGSRYLAGGGSADLTVLRSTGNRCFVALANVLHGARFTDLCYGYCAFWRDRLDALRLTADGFEIETELALASLRARLAIREIPSHELERRAGTSNLKAVRDGLRVLRTMIAARRRRRAPAPCGFVLQRVEVPVWRSDRLPTGAERRCRERRVVDRATSGYQGPERRLGERRECVGAVATYRAVYDHSTSAANR
jgi:hypothetical protein